MKPKVCTFVKSGTKPEHFPPADLPEVAFAGRSNVGKSSLLNSAMYRKDLVKVSQTPGRTRLLSWFEVDQRLRLCDLPGYGFAKVGGGEQLAWQKMIETYLQKREVLRALAILVDVRRGFEEEEQLLLRTCHQWKLQPILIVTKCDQLKSNALYNRKVAIAREMGGDMKRDFIWYSSKDHDGRDDLWRRILGLTGLADVAGG